MVWFVVAEVGPRWLRVGGELGFVVVAPVGLIADRQIVGGTDVCRWKSP